MLKNKTQIIITKVHQAVRKKAILQIELTVRNKII